MQDGRHLNLPELLRPLHHSNSENYPQLTSITIMYVYGLALLDECKNCFALDVI